MTEPAQVEAIDADGWEWAIVEIFGHRRHIGRVREEERFGIKMIRVDTGVIPEHGTLSEAVWTAHYYKPSAIFCLIPSDEATVDEMTPRSIGDGVALPSDGHRDYDHG